jgi:serine/threonine protein kinase
MPLSTGDRIGPYEVLSAIGAGGMGTVYRARDSRLHRVVAIKLLAEGSDVVAGHRHLLLQEARAAAALSHTNIVTVYDVGSDAGADFIAMECVDGQSLGELLASESPPLAEKLAFAICVAMRWRPHTPRDHPGDVKPGNIMVTPERQIKVVDRLSKAAGRRSRAAGIHTY